ncbi:MAG TPA: TIGR03013 family XrtA/PEP-CTERM system glycosyltransferase [Vicinamibacterales bacterium]|nr:TIGR03013 family XrtA/PEP-CTERM system glycosyltransferase [Vicinamibacterales bacterium]
MFNKTWRSFLLVAGETALLVAAVVISSVVIGGEHAWELLRDNTAFLRVLLIVVTCQLCLHYADLYDLRTITTKGDLATRLMRALGATSLILGIAYWLFPLLVVQQGVFLLTAALAMVLVMMWRSAFDVITARLAPRERLLLVGTSPAAIVLARELFERRQELGVDIVGFVDPDPTRVGAPVINPGVVGTIDDIPGLTARMHVDRVVVSLSDERGKLPMDKLLDVRMRTGVLFDHLASVYEEYTGKIALENLRPSWLVFSTGFRKTRLWLLTKRTCDIVAAVCGLILSLPLTLMTAILVKLESPRDPVLYHQERVGLNGAPFTIHKFRTMRSDAEAGTGPVWSAGDSDPRITKVGRFLRKTRLDEIPQLWNVLIGDMSLIGPRPERPGFVEQLTRQIPFYGQRHVVKPGVTGWAQVRYAYGASVEDALEKMQYDLYYVKHMSLMFDIMIALETIKTVVLRRGAR